MDFPYQRCCSAEIELYLSALQNKFQTRVILIALSWGEVASISTQVITFNVGLKRSCVNYNFWILMCQNMSKLPSLSQFFLLWLFDYDVHWLTFHRWRNSSANRRAKFYLIEEEFWNRRGLIHQHFNLRVNPWIM